MGEGDGADGDADEGEGEWALEAVFDLEEDEDEDCDTEEAGVVTGGDDTFGFGDGDGRGKREVKNLEAVSLSGGQGAELEPGAIDWTGEVVGIETEDTLEQGVGREFEDEGGGEEGGVGIAEESVRAIDCLESGSDGEDEEEVIETTAADGAGEIVEIETDDERGEEERGSEIVGEEVEFWRALEGEGGDALKE